MCFPCSALTLPLLLRLPYNEFFGGVSGLTVEQFQKINGFPNAFWGWGGEDDDLWNRYGLGSASVPDLCSDGGSAGRALPMPGGRVVPPASTGLASPRKIQPGRGGSWEWAVGWKRTAKRRLGSERLCARYPALRRSNCSRPSQSLGVLNAS